MSALPAFDSRMQALRRAWAIERSLLPCKACARWYGWRCVAGSRRRTPHRL